MNGHALYADGEATVHCHYQSSGDKSMLNHRRESLLFFVGFSSIDAHSLRLLLPPSQGLPIDPQPVIDLLA